MYDEIKKEIRDIGWKMEEKNSSCGTVNKGMFESEQLEF